MRNTTTAGQNRQPDPVTGTVRQEKEYYFNCEKVVHSKDETGGLERILKRGTYRAGGRKAFDENGEHVGFRCSASCRPLVAGGHNRRDERFTGKLVHVNRDGYSKTYLDYDSLDKKYQEIFGEALEEYNSTLRKDRRIKNYLTHILEDQRRGCNQNSTSADTSRKPVYEFIFQIGNRDNYLDKETSIAVLEKFVLEWMPEHYPNLKAIGIYLHADEQTNDAVTGERLDGSVHVHFDYIPLAHRGASLNKGMKLQTSMSGACAEMGFFTRGKRTAQIQMEEAVRKDLMDLAESYGIKVNREKIKNPDRRVDIDSYKVREDNKQILMENQKVLEENRKIEKSIDRKHTQLEARQKKVEKAEEKYRAAEELEDRANRTLEVVTPYVERIDSLDENERKVMQKLDSVQTRENIVELKESRLKEEEERQMEKENRLEELENEACSQMNENEKQQLQLQKERQQLEEERKKLEEEKMKNEETEIRIMERNSDFRKKEAEYEMLRIVTRNVNTAEEELDKLGENFRHDLLNGGSRGFDRVLSEFISNTKRYVRGLIMKFREQTRIVEKYFQGKKKQDLKKVVDDMESNGIDSFEEYDRLHREGKLNWQFRQAEEKKRILEEKKKRRYSYEMGW